MEPNRALIRSLSVACMAAALGTTSLAPGQCANQWLPGDGIAGTGYRVSAATHWDPDGPGPRTKLVVLGGQFVVAGDVVGNHIATWDPTTGAWGSLGSGMNDPVRALSVLPGGDLVAGGFFTTAGGAAANHIARWDGTAWQPLGAGTSHEVLALTVLPSGDLIAGGPFPGAGGIPVGGVARWDGSQWHSLGAAARYRVQALGVLPNGDLVAGGDFTSIGGIAANYIAQWDGSQWHPLGTGLTGGREGVLALAVLPTGDVVAGGDFWSAGGVQTRGIARWDGSQWLAMPGGNNSNFNDVHALLVLPNGELIAGGSFYHLPGQPTLSNFIARWDGATWHTLGPGTDFSVDALVALPGGGLIAGGHGNHVSHVARWDGAAWHELPPGGTLIDGAVGDVRILSNGDLVVAGSTRTGSYVARWDASSWQSIPLPPRFRASALMAQPNGDLIAGGSHEVSFPIQQITPKVYGFDGNAWLLLGSGTPSSLLGESVFALARLPSGELIAGGFFSNFGGSGAGSIARFDGSAWHALGAGTGGWVHALEVLQNGDLAVGGHFGIPVTGGSSFDVARWDGAAWHPYGAGFSGLASTVNTLLQLPNGDLVAAGAITRSGSVSLAGIARFDGSAWRPLGGGGLRGGWSSQGVANSMAMSRAGELYVGGSFTAAGPHASAYLATLTTSCPALATPVATTCVGPVGPMSLTADGLPWVGSTFRSTATGFAANALGVSLLGFRSPGVPLTSLHPMALPGCDQLADGLAVLLTFPVGGRSSFQWAIPNRVMFSGIQLHHQFLQVELGTPGAIVSLSSTNGLVLTLGAF